MILDAIDSAERCFPKSEKMELQKFGKDSRRLSHHTDPHTYTLSNVQVVFHTVKSEFSLTNNIMMRSDRDRKRAKFYRCDSSGN